MMISFETQDGRRLLMWPSLGIAVTQGMDGSGPVEVSMGGHWEVKTPLPEIVSQLNVAGS
jgi:hypothetical protein